MRLLFVAMMAVSPIVVSATLARAEPRSAKECASIEESFAYNECIAKFGPSGTGKIVAHAPGAVIANAPPPPPSDVGPPPTAATVPQRAVANVYRGAPARVSGSIYQRRANGRYFASFQVGRPVAARAAPTPAKAKTAAVPYSRWRRYRR